MTNQPLGTSGPQHSPQKNARNSTGRHTRLDTAAQPQQRYSNVVDVDRPNRVMDCFQLGRQLKLQYIVRCYISQILYGCHNPHCMIPTCLSCNKRRVSKPFRAPTRLTACALAHYLASRDNPTEGLCPHQLRVAPPSLEIEGTTGIDILNGHNGFLQLQQSHLGMHDDTWRAERTGTAALLDTQERSDAAKILHAVKRQHQAKKDPKSLGQNLYDTVAVIYSYSKHISNPLSLFASLRSPTSQVWELPSANPASGSRDGTSNEQLPSYTNGHAVHASVKGTPTTAQTSMDPQIHVGSSKKSNTMHITSEVLHNGQRIHKVHLPGPVRNSPTSKANDITLLDGTSDTSAMMKKPRERDVPMMTTTSAPLHAQPPGHREHVNSLSGKEVPTLPVTSHLNCQVMDQLKNETYDHRTGRSSEFSTIVDYDSNRRFRAAKPFVNRSIFFTLSDPETLLQSFRDEPNIAYKDSSLPHLNSACLTNSFADWNRLNGALIFDSLWIAVEALFRLPPELDAQKSPRLKPSRKNSASNGEARQNSSLNPEAVSGRYLNDSEAAHIIMICIHALTSLVPNGWPHVWVQLRMFRSWGVIIPNSSPQKESTDGFVDPWLSIVDELEYEPAIRLADRLLRGIGARMCFERILATLNYQDDDHREANRHAEASRLVEVLITHLGEVERVALASKSKMMSNLNYQEDPGWTVTSIFMEWLRTIIIKKWDGKAEVNKWSSVGTAISLLDKLHVHQDRLNLRTTMFHMPYLQERLDLVTVPVEFLDWEFQPNTLHVLEYPCLFLPTHLLGYFRTINFTNMFKQYEETERAAQLQRALDPFLDEPYKHLLRRRMRVTQSDYLVLFIRRDFALQDTLDHLWGNERRFFFKPLKINMGMHEGEVGQDQGGVTYEFFRVVLNEAFKPDNGMFTVDPETRMTWFQPAAFEPEWKFEMLGLLFSLAIYNGITLPVTFPIAFYHGLLHLSMSATDPYPKTTQFIRDGWPTLAKSLDQLLAWKDSDVADVFMRSYTFSFDAFGHSVDVDMQAFDNQENPLTWPAESSGWSHAWSPSTGPFGAKWYDVHDWPDRTSDHWKSPVSTVEEPPLITSDNRGKFVADYIFWLTYRSVAPQFMAFRKGFYACLHPKALSLFDAASLKALVEGTQDIHIPALKKATRYEDGYSATHPTITDFWSIVETYTADDKRRLLDFVTASERVPVTGFESMNFVIGTQLNAELLPTSSTCFGKLMLPAYASRETMREKLALAIQNSEGFGLA
ncbi:hypothetical protein BDV95DRAFT_583012 [Massariosphaeria phaeospora]|uniref:HECT-type E3 ubiquitin transferase n=1 Tax=Massariosphaeria phaeospora TaxID=100035 RepID=A0A7C8I338_9PLEO|nr:hypothetical protein BDV95DRAFT_583012 [Massariosphaeria phaeospora]